MRKELVFFYLGGWAWFKGFDFCAITILTAADV